MAWTTPRTWVVGEVVTAAIMNTHIRDNLNFLYTPPQCSVTRNTNSGTITANVATTVQFDVENYDTNGMHDNVTLNTRIVTNVLGRYYATVGLAWANTTASVRNAAVLRNSTNSYPIIENAAPGGVTITMLSVSATVQPTATTDYYEAVGTQVTGGGTMQYSNFRQYPLLSLDWIGN